MTLFAKLTEPEREKRGVWMKGSSGFSIRTAFRWQSAMPFIGGK
ncbi:hypothetical protein [Gorillibacterium timonense]|nr:hypothetical protein [Gorillibacterium timonense]